MGKKMSKGELRVMMGLATAALVIAGIIALAASMGVALTFAVLVLIGGGMAWNQHAQQQQRLAELRAKYGSEAIVQSIVHGQHWQGQTEEQLRDALGSPVEVDDKRLKTLRREIWKYQKTGVNRFRLRITLENGVVVGWDQKA